MSSMAPGVGLPTLYRAQLARSWPSARNPQSDSARVECMTPTVYTLLLAQKGDAQVHRLLERLDELNARLACSAATHEAASPGPGNQLPPGLSRAASSSSIKSGLCNSRRHVAGATVDVAELKLPCIDESGPPPLFAGHASEHDALQQAAEGLSSNFHTKSTRDTWMRWAMRPANVAMVLELAWYACAAVFCPDDINSGSIQARTFQQMSQHYVHVVMSKQGQQGDQYQRLWLEATAQAAATLLRQAFPASAKKLGDDLVATLKQQMRLWTTGLLPGDGVADAAPTADGTDDSDGGSPQRRPRLTAAFAPCKPGPLMTESMAAHHLTPNTLWQGRRTYKQDCLIPDASAATGSAHKQPEATTSGRDLADTSTSSTRSHASSKGVFAQMAAVCMSNANQATTLYEQRCEADSAATRAARRQLRKEAAMFQQLSTMARRAPMQLQEMSNRISGWTDDSHPTNDSAVAAASDTACKAQRRLRELQDRALDKKVAQMGKGGKSLSLASAMQAAGIQPRPGGALHKHSSGSVANEPGAARAVIASSSYSMRSKTPNAPARISRAARGVVQQLQLS